ncbi:hypothetical protein, partial [Streptobacillus moniliformis]|uniref:hypothetical protein n=1 Tax=Streptobacillus moniliformis TaxID=34105 RepID=UPI001E30E232
FVKIDLEKIDLILLELYIILTPFCYLVWRLNYTEKEEVIQEFFLKFLITFFYYVEILTKYMGGGYIYINISKNRRMMNEKVIFNDVVCRIDFIFK